MLVSVIMIFLVLSFTGVAVLDISYSSRTASQETVDNIEVQYALESEINESLWQINSGEDSTVNCEEDGFIINWNADTKVLIISVDTLGVLAEISLNLSEDTHFQRGMASCAGIETNGYDTGIEEENRIRSFDFLPTVDLQYFVDHAVKVHNGNENAWKDDFLANEGIHIFTGNNISIDSVSVNNSTLVFTGKGITFTGTNTIKAPVPVDSADALPALVFVDPDNDFIINENDHIEGAIYCAGQLTIESAALTGPIIADFISLNDDIDILDSEFNEYYRWTLGFGDQDDYDWPKQIGRWKTNTWSKKPNS